MGWFNQKQNAVLGLDISTAAVKLLELSKVGTRYRVESYAVVPLTQEAFVDKNIANTDIIAEAISVATKQSGTKLREACVAVSGSAVMSKVITIPANMGDSEIEDQVLDEASQYVPYALDEVNLDFEVQRVNEANPLLLDVLLVASSPHRLACLRRPASWPRSCTPQWKRSPSARMRMACGTSLRHTAQALCIKRITQHLWILGRRPGAKWWPSWCANALRK